MSTIPKPITHKDMSTDDLQAQSTKISVLQKSGPLMNPVVIPQMGSALSALGSVLEYATNSESDWAKKMASYAEKFEYLVVECKRLQSEQPNNVSTAACKELEFLSMEARARIRASMVLPKSDFKTFYSQIPQTNLVASALNDMWNKPSKTRISPEDMYFKK